MINYNIDVYLRHTEMENMYVRELIELVTNDYNGNVFNFTIYDTDQKVYDLTSKTLSLIVKSELGTVIEDNCTIINATGGSAKIILPSDMFCEKGTYYAELQIWEGLNRITSLPFDYTVRLSMDSNEAVRADNRFSLLQQALKDVSDSNVIAAEAKTTAESALAKSNQAVATIDSQVSKVNTAASSANTALDRATSVVTQEELANKIGHNGIFDDTNFNFIGNKVAQDGLVLNKVIDNSKDFTIIVSYQFADPATSIVTQAKTINGIKTGWVFSLNSSNQYRLGYYDSTQDVVYTTFIDLLGENRSNRVIIKKLGTTIYLNINGNLKTVNVSEMITGKTDVSGFGIIYPYNRVLTAQEIQRTLSVLNNAESINALHAGGKKLLLASDTDHVTDRTGRTQQQINQVFYAQNGKEFIADSKGNINVNNGLEGWVNKAEIQGQTVKNLANPFFSSSATPAGLTRENVVENGNRIGLIYKGSVEYLGGELIVSSGEEFEFQTNTTYTFAYFVETNCTNIGSRPCVITTEPNMMLSIPTFKNGLNLITFTTPSLFTKNKGNPHVYPKPLDLNADGKYFTIKNKMIIVGDYSSHLRGYIPFGLSSTQAIINNNGQSYEFYEPTIQGKTRILKAPKGTQNWVEISSDEARDTAKFDYKLDSVGGDLGNTGIVSDLVDRTSKVKTVNTKEIIFNDITSISNYAHGFINTETHIGFRIEPNDYIKDVIDNGIVKCNKLQTVKITPNASTAISGDIDLGISTTGYGKIRKTLIPSGKLSDVLTYLKDNTAVRYQLATPQEVPLTDEELKTYDAYKKLILLPFAEDKVNLNEDGSATWVDASEQITINPELIDSGTSTVCTYPITVTGKLNSASKSNIMPTGVVDFRIHSSNSSLLIIEIDNSILTNIQQVKDAFRNLSEPCKVEYQRLNPVIAYIDKSITPTILTDKINILEVKSPVAPSSFKATLPINKNAEQDAEIQNLKDRLNTIMNVLYANPLLVNTYIDQEVQESQKAINERMM